jgi:GNAT superfamily N-acetyltransferase
VELILADLFLARRLEAADAANAACAAPHSINIAGGVAAFAGCGSPLTHAIGAGMRGAVTGAELDDIEMFYRARGSAVNIDLCPLADPSFIELVGRRPYRVVEFNNVLARRLAERPAFDGGVRQAAPHEMELWAQTTARGFFEHAAPSHEELEIGRALFRMSGAAAWIAFVDGVAAAAGAAAVRDGLLTMFGDSTLPAYRGRGLHRAMINARLSWGVDRGCDMAMAATLPGSASQRNYQRASFQIAYTKLNMQRDWR